MDKIWSGVFVWNVVTTRLITKKIRRAVHYSVKSSVKRDKFLHVVWKTLNGLNGIMAVTLRYFSEFGKPAFQHITAPTYGRIYAQVYCILQCVYDVVVKKVDICYLISQWVSCYISVVSLYCVRSNNICFRWLHASMLSVSWVCSAWHDNLLLSVILSQHSLYVVDCYFLASVFSPCGLHQVPLF